MKRFDIFIIISTIILYLIIQLPVFFQDNHVYRNLEPYPDGLIYTTTALNFVRGDGLNLVNGNAIIRSWVPLTYSLTLIPFYILIPKIDAFVFTNILLGMGSLTIIYQFISKITKNYLIKSLSILIYLLNGYILLLPTLPMTENLTLFSFALFSYFYTSKNQKTRLFGGLFATFLFIFIKFSNFLVGLAMIYILIKKQKHINLRKNKNIYLLFSFFLIISVIFFNNDLKHTILNSLNSEFFSLNNILPNLVFYVKSLTISSKFLWYSAPLSSFVLFFIWLIEIRLKKLQWLSLVLIAQLPTALLFYTSDARYLILFILALPIFLADYLSKFNYKKNVLTVGIICLVSSLFLQKDLIREVVANNLFGRSKAWQVESIYHFNSVLGDNDLIITSIPPLLINEYSNKRINSLPMSIHQEFISKNLNIWSTDIDLSNPKRSYNEIFNSGKKIYISNAYNSHNQLVQADFELFKELYNLRLISEGCEQTCNIYLLEGKE